MEEITSANLLICSSLFFLCIFIYNMHRVKWTTDILLYFLHCVCCVVQYLKEGAFTQNIVADVQMALSGTLGALWLCLPIRSGHTQLPCLGKRLDVMRRHIPKLQVWLITKQPETEQGWVCQRMSITLYLVFFTKEKTVEARSLHRLK